MFNLRTSLGCVPLILAAFTLALPNAPEHTSAPNVDYPEYHPIETNLGTVLCLHYNSYGQLIGEKLPLHNKPPTDWYFNASVSDIKPFRNVLANTEEVCNLGPQGCRTLGCKAGKGAIGWCNESGHKIRMPCRFLTEYVDEIVEVCGRRSIIHTYVNGMILVKGWPGDFTVWVGKPAGPFGCDWSY
ncbi:hypothetical protein QBC37DRAFT_31634 [Rhypophila decipiens]|uniref:Uncharacterized protein n=1 Tax=Rhypophila decipiens TaxID=261697 RepID=A0AAN6YGS3_9PEZI|nr:hypothetical protein QBC37DRAFT_31634 [Rhypophila decipiens]